MTGPVGAFLPDGRLHLQHGPIDLVIEAFGSPGEVRAAYAQAAARFDTILTPLAADLAGLRTPIGDTYPLFAGPVARRMASAVWPHRSRFITPMAAVAGAVADEVLAAMLAGRLLDRAYVNNGGDIALHLAPGQRFNAGIVADPHQAALAAVADVDAADPVRGIATSGWGGRSFSLGIADAVTVLAADAATADAAATIIANAVDADHPGIRRAPARNLQPDSDLGERLVTVHVPQLPVDLLDRALKAGIAVADGLRRQGLIFAAGLVAQGRFRSLGIPARPLVQGEVA